MLLPHHPALHPEPLYQLSLLLGTIRHHLQLQLVLQHTLTRLHRRMLIHPICLPIQARPHLNMDTLARLLFLQRRLQHPLDLAPMCLDSTQLQSQTLLPRNLLLRLT